MSNPQGEGLKTLIGVLASHDSPEKNISVAKLFKELHQRDPDRLDEFHFLFTGGTFSRVLFPGELKPGKPMVGEVDGFDVTQQFLLDGRVTCLPPYAEGGVLLLAYLVAQRKCNIVWPFLTPSTTHWLNCENLALLRLCDVWRAKRLMNYGSVREWFLYESDEDKWRSLQKIPLSIKLREGSGGPWETVITCHREQDKDYFSVQPPMIPGRKPPEEILEHLDDWTIALIAHDEMKPRMMDFVVDYEAELAHFGCILATGTTGAEIKNAAPRLEDVVFLYHSGPIGGDIEIATEILYGRCHAVIFFIDPSHPHPHIEDIRVLLGACILNDRVLTFTNEMQAREWMNRVVRGRKRT